MRRLVLLDYSVGQMQSIELELGLSLLLYPMIAAEKPVLLVANDFSS
jgi:hypothetical protein